MTLLHDPVSLIQQNLDTWGTPYVELDTFATDRAEQIVDIVNAFCLAHMGAKLAGYLFYGSSVGSTHGVRLTDGREIVIKSRPPIHVNPDLKHDRQSLDLICSVMRWLRAQDYPCPSVLLGPTPIGKGLATVEEYFAPGDYGDAFVPACRRAIARGFAELIALLRTYDGTVSSLQHFQRGSALYPQPHGKIFNFEATATGAEWIDEFARRARDTETHDGARALGHADWKIEHLRFQDGRIVATYDWDSLAFRTETELVGGSAPGFTADWTREGVRRIPSAEDIRAYIADYEHARGQSFTKQDRQSVFASCVYWIAYGARCTHALSPSTTEWEEDSWPHLLRTEGKALLAEATG